MVAAMMDPQSGTAVASRERRLPTIRPAGFTLIEMGAVLMITAILAALAAPSFRDFTTGQRIRATSFDLFADLTYARSEAIKTNSEVIVGKAAGGWKNGWNITWIDSGGATRTLRAQPALDSSLAVAGTQDMVRFERNGRLLAGTPAAKFTVVDSAGKASISARCVAVDPSGRPKATFGACA
jgi:type IV fimbrial biogenesis protein FimT